jgi:predicted PurR-regulated permease PerM
MIERLPRHRRNWILGALLLLVLWFAWSIKAVLNPLLLGYTLAAIVAPFVRTLEKRGWRHRTAVVTVFVAALGSTLLVLLGLALQVRSLVIEVAAPGRGGEAVEAPVGDESEPRAGAATSDGSVVDVVSPAATEVPPQDGADVAAQDTSEPRVSPIVALVDRIDARVSQFVPLLEPGSVRGAFDALVSGGEDGGVLRAAGQASGQVARGLWSGLGSALEAIFGLSTLVLLVPLYAFFWMFEMDALNGWVRRHVPVRERERTSRIAKRMGEILSRFFRGRLAICALKGAFVAIALALCGVKYSLLLGTLAGLLSLIPFVGSVVAFALGLVVAVAYRENPWIGVAVAVAVYGVAELVEGYVLVPRILGESLGLSEVAVLFAVTAGGAALGLFGVLAALPIAAGIKVAFLEYVAPALKQWADESSPRAPSRS